MFRRDCELGFYVKLDGAFLVIVHHTNRKSLLLHDVMDRPRNFNIGDRPLQVVHLVDDFGSIPNSRLVDLDEGVDHRDKQQG